MSSQRKERSLWGKIRERGEVRGYNRRDRVGGFLHRRVALKGKMKDRKEIFLLFIFAEISSHSWNHTYSPYFPLSDTNRLESDNLPAAASTP
jgi:hypothetical protein